MQDAALYYAQFSEEKSDVLAKLGNPKNFALTTIHRAENTDDPIRLTSIISALNEINKSQQVICPLHPRTRKILENLPEKPAFSIIDPVGYFDMIELLKHASLVMTDSGGLQKEAFFFQNACITMRDQTEWTELVDNGYNMLAGADKEAILGAYDTMRSLNLDFSKDLYGGGMASANIANVLVSL
jgi:UDP-GlcNAc3NAcA epimerase